MYWSKVSIFNAIVIFGVWVRPNTDPMHKEVPVAKLLLPNDSKP